MPDDRKTSRRYTSAHWGTYEVSHRVGSNEELELRPLSGEEEPAPFGPSMAESVTSHCRIRNPSVRAGYLKAGPASQAKRGQEPFVEVSWDTAFDLAATTLHSVYEQHGAEAIYGGSYGWASAGRFHHAVGQLHRFLNCLGGYTGSVNTYSHAAAEVLLPHIVGEEDDIIYNGSTWPVIVENTQFMLCFGGLPCHPSQINPGGVSNHSVKYWLKRCKEQGIKRIDITPVRDRLSIECEAQWLPVRPNTDTAIMMGIASALIENNLHDTTFLSRYTVGFDVFRDYLDGTKDKVAKSPEWAAEISGLAAQDIRQLARDIASKRTLLSATWSLQRADHGEQPFWMLVVLAAMVGQIGLPGGGFAFGLTSMNGIANPVNRKRFASLPQGTNPVTTKIPVARITDLLMHPHKIIDYDGERIQYPDIKLVYWAGGNPFHHHQDLAQLCKAWQRPETVICNELNWNALARHSDIVFPVAGPLERNDIMAAKSDCRIVAMRKACSSDFDVRTDYQIFSQLAERLGAGEAFTEGRDEKDWLLWMYNRSVQMFREQEIELPPFDDFWDSGIFQHSSEDFNRVLLQDFRKHPETHKLCTPSGLIEIYSSKIASFEYGDCPGHPVWLEPREWASASSPTTRFHLISDQPVRRLHSQLDNVGISRDAKINGREPARLNPIDAAAIGVAEGDTLRLHNERGAVLVSAVLSDDVACGIVQLSTGAWFDPVDDSQNGLVTCVHGNPNVLTGDVGTSRLSQGPSPLSTTVEVERFTGSLKPVTAHQPPVFVSLPDRLEQ